MSDFADFKNVHMSICKTKLLTGRGRGQGLSGISSQECKLFLSAPLSIYLSLCKKYDIVHICYRWISNVIFDLTWFVLRDSFVFMDLTLFVAANYKQRHQGNCSKSWIAKKMEGNKIGKKQTFLVKNET